jgi:hypothetical protein
MDTPTSKTRPRFTNPTYLRRLLARLEDGGPEAWRTDPEAAELAEFLIAQFKDKAAKSGLDPDEGGAIAFEQIRKGAGSRASDRHPFAVIVHAACLHIDAEQVANEMLTSADKARRHSVRGLHTERLSEREPHYWEHHPALSDDGGFDDEPVDSPLADIAVRLFTANGWHQADAQRCVDAVLDRLDQAGSRATALESLRRDQVTRVRLGIGKRPWNHMARILLGHPADYLAGTRAGYGLLYLIASGFTETELGGDPEWQRMIRAAAPSFVPPRRAVW